MRWFLTLVVVVVAAVGGLMIGQRGGSATEADDKRRLVKVVRGPIAVVVQASGAVEPERTVEVKSKAGGEVQRRPFEEGDRVSVGDLLLELDPSDEERSVERMEANLAIEQARLETARAARELARSSFERAVASAQGELERAQAALREVTARFERQKELRREGTISQQELDGVQSEFSQARTRVMVAEADLADAQTLRHQVHQREQDIVLSEASVRVARLSVAEARERLRETRITSPIDGVITRTFVNEGQVISSAISNVGGGTTLMEVADLSKLYVEASVDEVDIGQITEGQQATIIADAFPTRTFEGVVRTISPRGNEVNSVVVFTVKVEVQGDGLELLRPGMTVTVAIAAGRMDDALLLPLQAVYYDEVRPYAIPPDVRDPEDSKQWRYIDIGLNDGLNVQILGGLEEGDEVQIRREMVNRTWRRR